MSLSHAAIWSISFVSILLMLIRPRNIPEVWWICAGATALVALRLMPLHMAIKAIDKGNDVYLFLIGMMLLAELAQVHGVFDWLATVAIQRAKGSRTRLFVLIYTAGTLVTIFMSNDATAVVLTPAILAAVKKTKADPLPYLFICAFIANAASFVFPISNPANLVVFRRDMPPLDRWLGMFLVASVVSIVATYFMLRWYCTEGLKGEMESDTEAVKLSSSGQLMLIGLGIVAVVLLISSALGKDLGLPACVASICIAIGLSVRERMNPLKLINGISWSVLPLVAGLFVLVEAVSSAGVLHLCQRAFQALQHWEPLRATMLASFAVGVGTNVINNLPLGLIAGASVNAAHVTGPLRNAILIGVDLGPNLSITGSLATILWLIAIRKEGLHVSAWTFLKAGFFVMPPALFLATLASTLFSR